ncbi:hypothetical protein FRC07_006989 [Ceratobasidium sp. 392]|nr:hypothetical protein FRC07_006989 [Ceratobasidium sp. 392]
MSQYQSCLEMLAKARKLTDPSNVSYARKIKEIDIIETDALEGFQPVEIRRRPHVDPLKKLPMEILSQICEIAVDVSDAETGPRGASHFAVVLGSVCHALRILVHQTPSLWQRVTFHESMFARKSAFWLDKLDGLSLYSVTLVWISQPEVEELAEMLEDNSPESWKCLRIECDSMDVAELCRELGHYLALSLHSFAIIDTESDFDGYSCSPGYLLTCMAPVPKTQTAGTYTRSISLRVSNIHALLVLFPYVTELQLELIQLAPSQYDFMHQILCAAPNLRSLIIDWCGYFNNELDVAPISPVPELESGDLLRHERLEILRLCKHGPEKTNPPVRLPKLQSLDLDGLSEKSVALIPSYLLETTPGASPLIRRMRLRYLHFADSRVLVKLALEGFTQTLESLEAASFPTDLSNYILYMISGPFGNLKDSIVCPRLQDLTFSRAGNLKLDSLVHIIRARLPSSNVSSSSSPTPIRTLVIDECTVIHDEALL